MSDKPTQTTNELIEYKEQLFTQIARDLETFGLTLVTTQNGDYHSIVMERRMIKATKDKMPFDKWGAIKWGLAISLVVVFVVGVLATFGVLPS